MASFEGSTAEYIIVTVRNSLSLDQEVAKLAKSALEELASDSHAVESCVQFLTNKCSGSEDGSQLWDEIGLGVVNFLGNAVKFSFEDFSSQLKSNVMSLSLMLLQNETEKVFEYAAVIVSDISNMVRDWAELKAIAGTWSVGTDDDKCRYLLLAAMVLLAEENPNIIVKIEVVSQCILDKTGSDAVAVAATRAMRAFLSNLRNQKKVAVTTLLPGVLHNALRFIRGRNADGAHISLLLISQLATADRKALNENLNAVIDVCFEALMPANESNSEVLNAAGGLVGNLFMFHSSAIDKTAGEQILRLWQTLFACATVLEGSQLNSEHMQLCEGDYSSVNFLPPYIDEIISRQRQLLHNASREFTIQMLKFIFQISSSAVSSDRYLACTLLQSMCEVAAGVMAENVVQKVITLCVKLSLEASEPVSIVREAAIHALREAYRYLPAGKMGLFPMALENICKNLLDTSEYVRAEACGTLASFVDKMPRDAVAPYLSELLTRIGNLLGSTRPVVLYLAINVIGLIAFAVKDLFLPYVETMCKYLEPWLTSTDPQLGEVRCCTFSTLGHICRGVGRDAFAPYYNTCAQVILGYWKFHTPEFMGVAVFVNDTALVVEDLLEPYIPDLLMEFKGTFQGWHLEDGEGGKVDSDDPAAVLMQQVPYAMLDLANPEGNREDRKRRLANSGRREKHIKMALEAFAVIILRYPERIIDTLPEYLTIMDETFIFGSNPRVWDAALLVLKGILVGLKKLLDFPKKPLNSITPPVAAILEITIECVYDAITSENPNIVNAAYPIALDCFGMALGPHIINLRFRKLKQQFSGLGVTAGDAFHDFIKNTALDSWVKENDLMSEQSKTNISNLIEYLALSTGPAYATKFSELLPRFVTLCKPKMPATDKALAAATCCAVVKQCGPAILKNEKELLQMGSKALAESYTGARAYGALLLEALVRANGSGAPFQRHFPEMLKWLYPVATRPLQTEIPDSGVDITSAMMAVAAILKHSPANSPIIGPTMETLLNLLPLFTKYHKTVHGVYEGVFSVALSPSPAFTSSSLTTLLSKVGIELQNGQDPAFFQGCLKQLKTGKGDDVFAVAVASVDDEASKQAILQLVR